jgi:phage-related protein
MKIKMVRRGVWSLYAACTERGDCPLLDFLYEGSWVTRAGLRPKDARANEKVRMLARLAAVADTGPPRNAKICHQIDEEIWQIELGRIRILWFYDAGKIIILSHGFLKASAKTPEREKQMAREALRRYAEAKTSKKLEILEDHP